MSSAYEKLFIVREWRWSTIDQYVSERVAAPLHFTGARTARRERFMIAGEERGGESTGVGLTEGAGQRVAQW